MNKKIIARIEELRHEMRSKHIDYYIVPTNDYHGSEYVGDYFKCREFITGFTGSAGVALISLNVAILWTDGRYFLQAEEQLKGTSVELYKQGVEGYPTIEEYLRGHAANKVIGFDGKVLGASFVNMLARGLKDINVKFEPRFDLIGAIWKDRPAMSLTPAYLLDIKYVGEARSSKLARLEKRLEELGASAFVITSLDDIAWLYNLRASDVECNPVLLSYSLYYNGEYVLYTNPLAISDDVKTELEKDGVKIKKYDDIYEDVKGINGNVLLDLSKVNYLLYNLLSNNHIINRINPTTEMKCIKNDVEIKNSYLAHLKDGICVTKFIYWLKQNVGKMKITEISAATYLENLRRGMEGFKDLSFPTISGYDYHGAIIHYDPTEETDIEVLPKSFLLVDSGAQYLEGTTDITRTIAVGELSEEQKRNYTLVLKGHLALGAAVFPEKTPGVMLDMLARKPLWEQGLDYKHGTGHGVGFFLNVHEGPQRIANSAMGCSYPFYAGMITSNEPGVYLPGKYGIRIENLTVCLSKEETEFGKFLMMDALTVAPYEKDAIVVSMLNEDEKKVLNSYNARLRKELTPHLTKDEAKWLEEVTEVIK